MGQLMSDSYGCFRRFINFIPLLLFFFPGFPNYDPYEYSSDYDNYDGDDIAINEEEENEIRVDINFKNTGTTEIVDRGTTIKLPCYVDKFPGKH